MGGINAEYMGIGFQNITASNSADMRIDITAPPQLVNYKDLYLAVHKQLSEATDKYHQEIQKRDGIIKILLDKCNELEGKLNTQNLTMELVQKINDAQESRQSSSASPTIVTSLPTIIQLPDMQQSQPSFSMIKLETSTDTAISSENNSIRGSPEPENAQFPSSSGKTPREKRHKCDWENCDKAFYRGDELKRHMRVHTKIKPFACTYCDRHFSRSDHLRSHIRIHTGDKPYKCDYCEKDFAKGEAAQLDEMQGVALITDLLQTAAANVNRGAVQIKQETAGTPVPDNDATALPVFQMQ